MSARKLWAALVIVLGFAFVNALQVGAQDAAPAVEKPGTITSAAHNFLADIPNLPN